MEAATDFVVLKHLRARVDQLAHRRRAAEERLAHLPGSPSSTQLQAMRVELAELEWQLASLEAESVVRG
jgi:hypothetical protein